MNKNRDLELAGRLLANKRKEARLNQEDLAEILGKPQSYVSRYEAGKQRLDTVELRRILDAIGADFMTFMADMDTSLKELEKEDTMEQEALTSLDDDGGPIEVEPVKDQEKKKETTDDKLDALLDLIHETNVTMKNVNTRLEDLEERMDDLEEEDDPEEDPDEDAEDYDPVLDTQDDEEEDHPNRPMELMGVKIIPGWKDGDEYASLSGKVTQEHRIIAEALIKYISQGGQGNITQAEVVRVMAQYFFDNLIPWLEENGYDPLPLPENMDEVIKERTEEAEAKWDTYHRKRAKSREREARIREKAREEGFREALKLKKNR